MEQVLTSSVLTQLMPPKYHNIWYLWDVNIETFLKAPDKLALAVREGQYPYLR
jgi:hypothetical protein